MNINDSSCSDSDLIAKNEEKDETGFEVRNVTGGKAYVRKLVSMSDASCILPDRRFTSIRQQSNQLLSMQTENANIAASPATVYRKRNRCRVKELENCEAILKATNALQRSDDGKKIDGTSFWVNFLIQMETDVKKFWV